jgi:hypothetical protein
VAVIVPDEPILKNGEVCNDKNHQQARASDPGNFKIRREGFFHFLLFVV